MSRTSDVMNEAYSLMAQYEKREALRDPRERIKDDMVAVQTALITAIDRVDRLIPEEERRTRIWRHLSAAQRAVTDACGELYRRPGCLVGE